MNAGDRRDFAAALAQLFVVYGDSVTPALADAWWGALLPYPIHDILQAMNRHAVDPEAGMYRATPAHIVKHLEAIEAERAQRILAARRNAQPRIDALEDVLYRLLHDRDRGNSGPDAEREIARLQRSLREERQRINATIIGITSEHVHQDHPQRKVGKGS